MTNLDAPRGLVPTGHLSGGTPNRLNEYSIASAYGTNIFTGQLVERTGTGSNIAVSGVTNADNLGVFAGVRYVDANGHPVWARYWTASTVGTDIVALVYDDPDTIFTIQNDGTYTAAMEGNVADTAGTGGNTATGLTTQELGTASVATSGSGQLKILGLTKRVDNEVGLNADVNVIINEHINRATSAAV